ncbi:MAG: DUF2752 domain-containing protein [Planctomycetota bacterium]|jgi:hypothetical protein
MQANKSSYKQKIFCRAPVRQRILAGILFLLITGLFAVLWLAGAGKINLGFILDPCGAKQRYGLPCPTCGITTSAITFAGGRIFKAFYIQPAGAFICCCLVIGAFLSLLTSVFGVYFRFLKRFLDDVKIKHLVLMFLVVIASGWLVTLARVLAESRAG